MSVKQIPAPTLSDVLVAQKRDIFSTMNCVQVGIIQDFDASNQTATILLALKQVIDISPAGVKTYQERPLIFKCPMLVLFGGTAFISLPIQPGDSCIVLFNDREIDSWFANGGIQSPASPRMHDVSDAIALVGINSLQSSITSYLTNGIRLSYGGGSSKIDLQENAINSLADLFLHTGNMKVTGNIEIEGDTKLDGNLEIDGTVVGNGGGAVTMGADINASGNTINANRLNGTTVHAANGANGTFGTVTVVDGIVTSGS